MASALSYIFIRVYYRVQGYLQAKLAYTQAYYCTASNIFRQIDIYPQEET